MSSEQPSPVAFDKSDVEIIAREILYSGFFSLNLYRFRHRLFNGEMSGEVKREIFERGHAAVLLPYDPVRDEVVLVEQLRIAAIDTSPSPWLLEMVAGMIEEGETVEEVARREAEEEAGIHIGRCKPVLSYLASPTALASAYLLWWAKLMPRRRAAFMVWPTKMKISGCMLSAVNRLVVGLKKVLLITQLQSLHYNGWRCTTYR